MDNFYPVVPHNPPTPDAPTGVCCVIETGECCADGYEPEGDICVQKCPCEGCCDYNCCDELDYFLHKAFEEMYSDQYTSFETFYDDWFADFYSWWYNGDLHYERVL